MFNNKKGSILDPILSSAYVVKIVVTIFIALVVWFGFSDVMSDVIVGTDSEAVLAPVITTLTNAYLSIDYMFPFIIGGLMIISIIFAYRTGANYVWGIISILFWAITVLLATVFTNVYIAVSNELPDIYAQMPIMDIIMINLRWVALVWIAMISLVMFRKNNQEDEGSNIQQRAYG